MRLKCSPGETGDCTTVYKIRHSCVKLSNWIQVAPVKLESMFNICCVLFIYLFI